MLIITQRTSVFPLDLCLQDTESGPHQGIKFNNMDKIKRLQFLPVNLGPLNVFILCEAKLVLCVDT